MRSAHAWYLLFAALLLLGVLAVLLIGLGILRSPAETRWIGVALVPVIGLVVKLLGQEFQRLGERRRPLSPPQPPPVPTFRSDERNLCAAPGATQREEPPAPSPPQTNLQDPYPLLQ
ncbi:MAG: hypothetical protein PVJ57_00230 [Phycisphaerae bacterium]|jgi:hypothetical protein